MAYLPVVLNAKRGNWQRFQARKRNQRFLAVRDKIFVRDRHTCRYCGFQSQKYQEVVNHDNNYANNKTANLVTACSLCAQCFFLDSVGQDKNTGGYVIYLPEISQADLNHFCRVLFSSMLRDAPYKGKLQTTYMSLKDRGQTVDQLFGPQSHEPTTFGQTLIDTNLNNKVSQLELMKNLRLLPRRVNIPDQVKYWKETVFDQIPL